MVAAEATFDVPESDEIFLVSQRKYNLDPDRPWWQRAFFHYVFLPFVRFAFQRMKIPAVGAIESDGSVIIIEQQGVYTDEQLARESCLNEFWSVKRLPLNYPLPSSSVQYRGHLAPLSVMPDRYRRRTQPLTLEPLGLLRQVDQQIDNLAKKAAGA